MIKAIRCMRENLENSEKSKRRRKKITYHYSPNKQGLCFGAFIRYMFQNLYMLETAGIIL